MRYKQLTWLACCKYAGCPAIYLAYENMVSVTAESFFVYGGTLKPSVPSYIERPADAEFFRRLTDHSCRLECFKRSLIW
jgi:hypothetical protein